MPLKIIKACESITIERVNLCIYAPPGVGKTTLAQTAEDPLTIDFDKGIHRASNRKDHVPVSSWQEAAAITAEDIAPYKTIVIDTAGRALDFLSAAIIKDNPKAGRADGSLTLQGFGTLKARFGTWLKSLNMLGKDVVLIAHMDEQKNGDDVIERLDVQGGSKGEIYKSVDAMGRIFVRGKDRVLDFSPRENAFGKNPANLDVIQIPAPHSPEGRVFLATVISTIKAKMNELTEEQLEMQKLMAEWSDAVKDFSTPEEFNQQLPLVKKLPQAVQLLFHAAAKEKGLVPNKKTHQYEAPQEVA